MTVIINKPTIDEEHVIEMRNAYEHRATWMSLLLDEARKSGLDWDDFARKAIFRCGSFHGENLTAKCPDISDLKEFAKVFSTPTSKKVFEMDVTKLSDDEFFVEFHYCPLVSAWVKQGFSDEDIAKLCDIAMDGDRGIADKFPAFQFELGKTIAQGNPVCEIHFAKKR